MQHKLPTLPGFTVADILQGVARLNQGGFKVADFAPPETEVQRRDRLAAQQTPEPPPRLA